MPFLLSDEQVKILLDYFYKDGTPTLPIDLGNVIASLAELVNAQSIINSTQPAR
jgi:hypothetical protein